MKPILNLFANSKFRIDKSVLYRKLIHVLNRYIPVEEIPIQYGGLKRENDYEFSSEDGVASELILKASSTATIEIPAPQVLKKMSPFHDLLKINSV